MKFIIRPLVTEKMNRLTDKEQKYGFIVSPRANKVQIKYRFLQYSNFSSVNQADKNADKY